MFVRTHCKARNKKRDFEKHKFFAKSNLGQVQSQERENRDVGSVLEKLVTMTTWSLYLEEILTPMKQQCVIFSLYDFYTCLNKLGVTCSLVSFQRAGRKMHNWSESCQLSSSVSNLCAAAVSYLHYTERAFLMAPFFSPCSPVDSLHSSFSPFTQKYCSQEGIVNINFFTI